MRFDTPQMPGRLRARCRCLFLGILVTALACAGCKPPKQETAEVSGTVKFKGKPLPGGRVSFVADKGGYSGSATIGEDGTYKVTDAPVGPVHITVDNSMLQAQHAPRAEPPKRPDAGAAETRDTAKGKYVAIPNKYAQPNKTDLTYTVSPGPQTHDVELP